LSGTGVARAEDSRAYIAGVEDGGAR
jgi:hypothetical protein